MRGALSKRVDGPATYERPSYARAPLHGGERAIGVSARRLVSCRRSRLRDHVMELVELVPRRLGEGVRIREGLRTLLEQRLEIRFDELLSLLLRLPDVEDPEDTILVVEPR